MRALSQASPKLVALAAGVALCALLSACATTAPAPSASTVAAWRDTIDLSGRLSVRYKKSGQDESLSGKFTWNQSADRTDVSLASPLGQTIAKIVVTPESATLTQADRAPRVARDIDSLTVQTLGWPLPVSGLREWLQGHATSADGSRFAASRLHDNVLTRDGWRIRFAAWQDQAGPNPQPKRIDAVRSATLQSDEITIRIVLDAPAS